MYSLFTYLGLNLKELNELIYHYSSKLSEIDLDTLSNFSLESLNSFRFIGDFSNIFKDSKVLDIQYIDHQEAIKAMRKRIRWPYIRTVLMKLVFVAFYFLTPYLLEVLTSSYQADEEIEEQRGQNEVEVWVYAVALLVVMLGELLLKNKYNWELMKMRFEYGTILRYLMFCKFTRLKESQETTDEKKKEEEASFLNVFNEVDTTMMYFENMNDTWYWIICLVFTIIILFLKVN